MIPNMACPCTLLYMQVEEGSLASNTAATAMQVLELPAPQNPLMQSAEVLVTSV